ncbi:tail completion protein gp17 [Sphingomonas sp. LHG3443-2]|uniref:tail completion protein gp17 n=1 Tax=Sphingomonas sp. LHG3443-2 TaxID=2804639 RepID=UPI003CED270F
MMSAIIALQEALVARLDQSSLFSGVYHDAPARAGFPFAVLNCSDERDWSCKGRRGREVVLQMVLWDEQPSRLLSLENEVEQSLTSLSTGSEWYLSTLLLTGKRRLRDPGGPWSCTFEFRARLIEHESGGVA